MPLSFGNSIWRALRRYIRRAPYLRVSIDPAQGAF
jgi:hypothetical protein